MRWRATVMAKLEFAAPRDAELLEHQLRQALAVRVRRAKVLHVDRPGSPQFVYLRVDSRSPYIDDARLQVAQLVRGVTGDVGATSGELVHWGARRRGPRGMVHKVGGGPVTGGGPGGGSGTAGVREPRRPHPPGFPPMQAAVDPSAD